MSAKVHISGKIATNLKVLERGDTVVLNFEVEAHDGNQVDFHKCTLWGQPGKVLEKLGRKGSIIEVNGKLKNNKYIPKGWNKEVTDTYVLVDDFELLDKRPDEQLSLY